MIKKDILLQRKEQNKLSKNSVGTEIWLSFTCNQTKGNKTEVKESVKRRDYPDETRKNKVAVTGYRIQLEQ